MLRWYRDFIREAPPELNGWFAFVTVPPAPPFPEHLHGRKMAAVVWCWSGPPEDADAAFAPVKAFGPPALYGSQQMPLPALQGMFDPLYPAGLQWQWRATSHRRSPTRRSSSTSGWRGVADRRLDDASLPDYWRRSDASVGMTPPSAIAT